MGICRNNWKSYLARKGSLNFMIQLCGNCPASWLIALASCCDNIHLPPGEMYKRPNNKSLSSCQLKNTAYLIFLSWWAHENDNCATMCLVETPHCPMRCYYDIHLFERLDWLPIDLCIKYFEGIQVYNILDGSCPGYLKGFIKLVDHGRNTRNSNTTNILKVPKTNLKLGE